MSFNKGMLTTLIILSSAKVNATTVNYPITEFEIKPISCIVGKLGDVCTLNATIEWKSDKKIDLCLLQDSRKLYCWDESDKGYKVLPVSLTETSNFMLTQSNNILASQKVAISSLQPKKQRRRLRSGWSIF